MSHMIKYFPLVHKIKRYTFLFLFTNSIFVNYTTKHYITLQNQDLVIIASYLSVYAHKIQSLNMPRFSFSFSLSLLVSDSYALFLPSYLPIFLSFILSFYPCLCLSPFLKLSLPLSVNFSVPPSNNYSIFNCQSMTNTIFCTVLLTFHIISHLLSSIHSRAGSAFKFMTS